jgi:hypothetical protein
LAKILVAGSTYARGNLKRRLFEEGLKERRCELCGQDESWRGRRMALILDHVNGIANDHRLENLRVVCPNCAATLDTHCGRNLPRERSCLGCGHVFPPKHIRQRYCTLECFNCRRTVRRGKAPPLAAAEGVREQLAVTSTWGIPRPGRRRAERPFYEELILDVDELGYCAVGRMHGVSDNATRKWIAQYEREYELIELGEIARD